MDEYTKFRRKTKGDLPRDVPGVAGAKWWTQAPDDAANAISANISFWADKQRWRMMELHRWACMYGNRGALGLPGMSLSVQSAMRSQYGEQITFNVSQSVVDTLTAKITRNVPKPLFMTNGGSYKQQRLAKNRNQFIDGVFYECKTRQLARLAVRDAGVWGPGIIRVMPRNGRVFHERVLPSELFVDEVEAITSEPRQMHRIKFVDRNVLCEMYPDSEAQIRDSHWTDGSAFLFGQHLADLICVRESWHLPSTSEADDGKRIITIGEHALTDMMPWRHNEFPFAILNYTPRMYGFWPQGLVEQGQSIQMELNRNAAVIQASLELGGTNKVWIKTGSAISPDHITNAISAIIEGEEMPQYMTPPIVQPEIYQERQNLIQAYYQLAGISQADASSARPSGELSGEAIRLVHDIGTERFVNFGQAYEEFHCDLARLSIMTAMDIMEESKEGTEEGVKFGYEVRSPNRGTIDVVDFNDLAFQPDEPFFIQCFPVSSLPSDPAGRTEKIQEYVEAGWIDSDTGRSLIDWPDIGRVEGLHNAKREFYLRTLDALVDDGAEYIPQPEDDLPMFLELTLEYLFNAKRMDAPEGRQVALHDLLQMINDSMAKLAGGGNPQSGAPAAAMPPAGLPPAVPQPPPVSQLIPNVNQAGAAA